MCIYCRNKDKQKGCKGEGIGSARPSQIGKSDNSLIKALDIKNTNVQLQVPVTFLVEPLQEKCLPK